jgi:predicted RNA-binding Zn-ribbon protein involved in translation (DUF1610 family)
MSLATKCPSCNQPVESDETREIGGKHYAVFHCPRCTERLGVGRQSAARRLMFVVDSEGRVRRYSELIRSMPG